MLARIAQELFWLGRDLTRAEHTTRMLDGVFHAQLGGGADQQTLQMSWDALLAVIGGPSGPAGGAVSPPRSGSIVEGRPSEHSAIEVIHLLTMDEHNPGSVYACVERGRERALRLRDVVSTEMWEAVNTFRFGFHRRAQTESLRTAPYSLYSYVKERCALFWGLAERTMVRDDARAFLDAGGRLEAADMVLRMLRVAIPPGAEAETGAEAELSEVPARGRGANEMRAIALLHAVGGAQAYSRAVRRPPNAGPVGRFLLFDRLYPGSVASAAQGLSEALRAGDPRPADSAPILRVARLIADLEFQARTRPAGGQFAQAVARAQDELAHVDADIALRYFAGSERA